jgi:hypothetical protein
LSTLTTEDHRKLQTKQPAEESGQDLGSSHKKNYPSGYFGEQIILHPSRTSDFVVKILK